MKAGFCHFFEFGTSDGLDIAYYDSTKCSSTFDHDKRSCIINQVCIINVIYAKNEVFGHFLEFGTQDGSHIAYFDSTKCFLTSDIGKRSCIINQVCIINVIYAKNEVFGHFLEFGTSDGFYIAHYDSTKRFKLKPKSLKA